MKVFPLSKDDKVFLEKLNEKGPTNLMPFHSSTREVGVTISSSLKEALSRITLAEVNPPIDKIEVIVNVSQDCNLACQYCFVNQGRFGYNTNRRTQLDPEHAKLLVDVLPKAFPRAKQFCIHFYGGEPLLNLPAIQQAIEASRNYERTRYSFSITTNGTIFNDDVKSVLIEGRFNVIISIDGPQHIHDVYRRTVNNEPTHHKVLEFLHNIKTEKLFVRGSSVVRKDWPLAKACAYLKSLPIDTIKAQAVRLPSDHPLALSEAEYHEYFRDLRQIASEVIDSIDRGKYPLDDRYNNRVLQLVKGTRRTSFCGAGLWTFGLDANGTVLPCALMAGREGTALGRIDESCEEWVINGRLWAQNRILQTKCKRCWAYPLCGGGCPAILSTCAESECRLIKANCQMALLIYSAYLDRPSDLLVLAGVYPI